MNKNVDQENNARLAELAGAPAVFAAQDTVLPGAKGGEKRLLAAADKKLVGTLELKLGAQVNLFIVDISFCFFLLFN